VDESRQSPERPQRLQLRSAIDDLLKLLRYQLDARITINANVPENIYCRLPEAGFRNVLLNLMLNAAQAIGERPGTIEIAAAVDDGRVELTIGDDGPGFPEELLSSGVFEHGTWRKGGTGFGLATARRFALEHGSSLELRNRRTGGATVILRFPVEDCDE
jgi:signal transduction histidine kinase